MASGSIIDDIFDQLNDYLVHLTDFFHCGVFENIRHKIDGRSFHNIGSGDEATIECEDR